MSGGGGTFCAYKELVHTWVDIHAGGIGGKVVAAGADVGYCGILWVKEGVWGGATGRGRRTIFSIQCIIYFIFYYRPTLSGHKPVIPAFVIVCSWAGGVCASCCFDVARGFVVARLPVVLVCNTVSVGGSEASLDPLALDCRV